MNLDAYYDQGLVYYVTKGNLRLYCYTRRCQYDNLWTDEILWCRGLVMDGETLVARPMKKFFDAPSLPKGEYETYPKLDGSLVLVSAYQGELVITTKGAFDSPVAKRARPFFHGLEAAFHPDYTYCFEFIHPEHRIIVDYGEQVSLTLLAVIHKATGHEIPLNEISGFPFPVLEPLTQEQITAQIADQSNKEGFVIRYSDGTRYKIKFDDYLALHRLVTGLSRKRIWQHLSDGLSEDDLIDKTPDEADEWIKREIASLREQYRDVLTHSKKVAQAISHYPRRQQYAYARELGIASVIMHVIDGVDPNVEIWKSIKP